MNAIALAAKILVITEKLKKLIEDINKNYTEKVQTIKAAYEAEVEKVNNISDEFKDIKEQRLNDLKKQLEERLKILDEFKQQMIDSVTGSLNGLMGKIKDEAEKQMKEAEEEKQKQDKERDLNRKKFDPSL